MLRALVLLLLVVNAGLWYWLHDDPQALQSDREPQRLNHQVSPDAVQVLPDLPADAKSRRAAPPAAAPASAEEQAASSAAAAASSAQDAASGAHLPAASAPHSTPTKAKPRSGQGR